MILPLNTNLKRAYRLKSVSGDDLHVLGGRFLCQKPRDKELPQVVDSRLQWKPGRLQRFYKMPDKISRTKRSSV